MPAPSEKACASFLSLLESRKIKFQPETPPDTGARARALLLLTKCCGIDQHRWQPPPAGKLIPPSRYINAMMARLQSSRSLSFVFRLPPCDKTSSCSRTTMLEATLRSAPAHCVGKPVKFELNSCNEQDCTRKESRARWRKSSM